MIILDNSHNRTVDINTQDLNIVVETALKENSPTVCE